MRAAPRLSWLPAWKLVSAKPSLPGSEGGSHDIETSCNVNISSKSPRISSEIPHTRGPNLGSKFLVYESRGRDLDRIQMKALTRLGWILANTIGSDHDRIKLIRNPKKSKLKQERFLVLQRESDLLSVDKWERLGLISQNPSSTPGEDRYMPIACFRDIDRSSEDFDAFFNRLRSGSSVTTGSTSLKGTLPLCALGTKIKLHDSSLSDFRGTLGTGKRKVGSLFSLPEDFIEGELDPVANKKVSHLAEYVHYTSENITPEVAGEMDKLGLDECYNRALKASQDVTFLLSRSLQDLAAIANVQLENEKLKSELQSCRSYEEKLSRENKTLKGRLNEVSKEKARMMKDLEELQAKHEDLVSQQKEMIDSVFERIMTEVWSVDPGLVVPRVEKWVDKSAILAAIETERESCLPQSGSLQRLSGVPQPKSPSRTLTFEAHASATSNAFIDLPIIKDKSEDDLLAM
ncbi:hypothetical protein WN943_018289 [Citrus x changshan-huyou]